MKKTFIIVTVNNRIEGFKTLLSSIYTNDKFDSYDITAVCQMYNSSEIEDIKSFADNRTKLIFSPDGIGANNARLVALKSTKSDFYINLDDDMVLTSYTDYESILRFLLENEQVGFVSGNWARTESMIANKKIVHKFVKQNIVYTGGGLCYLDRIADILRNTRFKESLFDDVEWSLHSYTNGYENYRYLGSVAIHRVVTKGGRRIWVNQKGRPLPDETLIQCKRAYMAGILNENNWLIPSSSNVLPKAHELHKANYKGVKK